MPGPAGVCDGVLVVNGNPTDVNDVVSYLHCGIVGRQFIRWFPLAEHVNGLAPDTRRQSRRQRLPDRPHITEINGLRDCGARPEFVLAWLRQIGVCHMIAP